MKLPEVTIHDIREGTRYHGHERAEGVLGERPFTATLKVPPWMRRPTRLVWRIRGAEWTLTFSERMKIAKRLWKVYRDFLRDKSDKQVRYQSTVERKIREEAQAARKAQAEAQG